MNRIEIRLDGKPVSKVTAAAALSEVGGPPVRICELDADGSIAHDVEVYARHQAFGETCSPEVNWSAPGSVSAARARQYAKLISLAAELAEMADRISG